MTSDERSSLTTDSIQIMQRLKTETKEYHLKLESLPYFKALMDHTLPLECYVNQLRALAIIHSSLEQELSTSKNSHISSVWDNDLRKLPLLEDDLNFFKPRVLYDTNASIDAALLMTEKIRLRKVDNPVTLLGYLYVLEGSTLGNSMHRPDISMTFHLGGLNGCAYYSSYHEKLQDHWNRFSKRMNQTLADSLLHGPVIEAAHEAFSGLESLYTALFPLDGKGKSFHVTRINPEAGNHPIPEDEREIKAALKASERAWLEFPYFEKRYGKRGKRFSDSDTCWLAALSALDESIVQHQVDWLSRVLASRGMPTITLETTLFCLKEELASAVPEKRADFEKLARAAALLRQARERLFSKDVIQSLVAEFEQAVDPEDSLAWKNSGLLIVSAVADERNGTEGAIKAVLECLTDENRFSGTWIRAVDHLVQKTQDSVQPI